MGNYHHRCYLTPQRWLALGKQLDIVAGTGAKAVLEIGAGSGIAAFAMREAGIDVKTFDMDDALAPDFVGDVRRLIDVIPARSFDCVLAAQVLEHIPWDDVPSALKGMHTVTRRWCIVSVPVAGITLRASLRWGRHRFHDWGIGGRMPAFWRGKGNFDSGEHRWELGTRHFTRKAFRQLLNRNFTIREESRHPTHDHMIFYLCEKRTDAKS